MCRRPVPSAFAPAPEAGAEGTPLWAIIAGEGRFAGETKRGKAPVPFGVSHHPVVSAGVADGHPQLQRLDSLDVLLRKNHKETGVSPEGESK